jgi:hypothetical protein
MHNQWRDVAVFLDGSPRRERIGRHAAALAQRHAAHLVGVYGVSHPSNLNPPKSFARGAGINQVLERQRATDEVKILAAGRAFAALIRAYEISSEFRVVWRERQDDDAALKALHSDLIVAARPAPDDLPSTWSAEHLLLVSGTPVLLVPDGWAEARIGARIVIAWNGSREVRRAVNDAMPFLAAAAQVTILIVDDTRSNRLDDEPGADIAGHLIGAYSRPTTAEILFGA